MLTSIVEFQKICASFMQVTVIVLVAPIEEQIFVDNFWNNIIQIT